MLTFFLIFVVLLINLFVYGLDSPQSYGVASHLYYGVMILAGIYDNRHGQYLLLAFTTLANWVHAGLYYEQIHLGVVAILYPIVAYFIVRTIQLFKDQRSTTEVQLQQIDQTNTDLEKRVADLSTLFEIGDTANTALELDELFQKIIRTLANRMGVYRGALRIWEDDELVKELSLIHISEPTRPY